MKNLFSVLRHYFAITTLFLASNTAYASFIEFSAAEDAFVNSGNRNTNYGSAALLRVGRADNANLSLGASRGTRIAYMYFDLSSVSSSTLIEQATLSLFQSDSQREPGGVRVSEVTSIWAEDTVTWNTAPTIGGSLFTTGTLPRGSVGQYTNLNLTSVVQDWIRDSSQNFGLALTLVDTSGGDTIASTEHPNFVGPSLRLDLSSAHAVSEPSAMMVLGSACLMLFMRRRRNK